MRIICTAIAAPLAARLPQLTGTGLPIRMSKSVLQRICQWLLGWLFFLFSFACLFIRWLLFHCEVARRSVTSKVEKESTRAFSPFGKTFLKNAHMQVSFGRSVA